MSEHLFPNILSILSLIAIVLMATYFIYKFFKYGYIGKKALFLVITYVLCYALSCYANVLSKGTDPSNEQILVAIAVSFWNALKMLTLSFESSTVETYFSDKNYGALFGVSYVALSVFGAVFISLSVILFFLKTAKSSLKNSLSLVFTKKNVYFIFSDPKVTIARKMAKELHDKNIVIMVVTRSSLKTQEGTEYKDMLISEGFEVWTENYSDKFANYLFEKRRFFWRKHKITVMGLFSDDELSSKLGLDFKDVIGKNKYIDSMKKNHSKPRIPLSKKEKNFLRHFRVFLTYHEYDFDYTYNISKETLHIVNTLSEYDMISSTFVLDNPIFNFINIDDVRKNPGSYEGKFNVTFLGFGKINAPIFEKMAMGYQLWGDNTLKVNYHIVSNDIKAVPDYADGYTDNNKKTGDFSTPYLFGITKEERDFSVTGEIEKYVKKISEDKISRFQENGFELFVISMGTTYFDIRVARKLHHALLQNFDDERLKHAVIFVRMSQKENGEEFMIANKDFVLSQEVIKQGKMFEDHPLCPVVPFGQDISMADYIEDIYYRINKVGIAVDAAYHRVLECPKDHESSWMFLDKASVLSNTGVAWSLPLELKLFGLNLSKKFIIKDGKKQVASSKFESEILNELKPERNSYLKCANSNVKLLSELEHNRWVTMEVMSKNSMLMDLKRFEDINIRTEKNKLINGFTQKDVKLRTKISDKKLHVCVTTNKGLKALYDFIVKKGGETEDIKTKAEKLVFGNDITQLSTIFKILYKENYVEEGEVK